MIHWFDYNGQSTRDFNCYITKKTSYDKPERDITSLSVPGRSGDLIIDNKRYKNISIEYGIKFFTDDITGRDNHDFSAQYRRISSWLTPTNNYFVLSDSYDPDYYRKACLSSSVNLTHPRKDIGTFSVKFNCKPYRYSYDGENTYTLTSSGTIYNPEDEESLPLIKIYIGETYQIATIIVGGTLFKVNTTGTAIIDSEMMNVYKRSGSANVNLNGAYTASGKDGFPILKSGNTTIQLVYGIDKVEIIPRWRTL